MKKLIYCLILLSQITACKPLKIVESTEVPVTLQNGHSEAKNGLYEHSTNTDAKDSVNIRDSIVIKYTDSIKIVDRWHTEFRDRLKVVHDTVTKNVEVYITDTVQVPVKVTKTVTKEVEVNKLYWWQEALMWIGVIILIYIVIKWILAKRN